MNDNQNKHHKNHSCHHHHQTHEHHETNQEQPYVENFAKHKSVSHEILIKKDNVKAIRLIIDENATLPKHKSKFSAILTCCRGDGILIMNETKHEIRPGSVFHLTPDDYHTISANSELELILIFLL